MLLDHTATDCTNGNAYALSLASKAAYGDDVPEFVVDGHTWPFELAEIAGFVTVTPYCTVVSHRGTKKLSNWLVDAMIKQVEDANYPGKVHYGFSAALGIVWDDILRAIPQDRDLPVFVAGHSLGGALATLCAHRLQKLDHQVQCYTYGSPRVGNTDFAAAYTVPTYRWVDVDDVVPHVPLEWSFVGMHPTQYKHVGEFHHINADGTVTDDEDVWGWRKRVAMDLLVNHGNLAVKAVTDHSIDLYVDKLAALQ